VFVLSSPYENPFSPRKNKTSFDLVKHNYDNNNDHVEIMKE